MGKEGISTSYSHKNAIALATKENAIAVVVSVGAKHSGDN